ncbi:N-acetyl-beta-hexosaminidase, partial [Klebsiella oxytoca]
EMWRNETPLTAQEILELDRYCRQRCIELIPSLASFGHLYMLLSTSSYGELCELEDSVNRPFSFEDRMQHHTINASDERAL